MANFDDQGIIDALNNIATAMNNVATQLKYLGNGNASTQMGAIEAYGVHMGERIDGIRDALESVATAINEHSSE